MKLKNLTLTAFIYFFSNSAFSTDTTTATSEAQRLINAEGTTNQIIYDNAEKTKPKGNTPTYVNPLSSTSSQPVAPTNLTDEQKVLSENFVHEGKANRVITENCKSKEMQDICNGQDPQSSRKAIIDGVAKAYAVFGGLMDDKFLQLKKSPAKTDAAKGAEKPTTDETKTDKAEKKDDNQTDYCKYIPMATETISMFMQQSAGKLLTLPTSSNETAQKETILKAAKNHEERAKGAQIQAAGWWGTAGCYGVMAATGTAITPSWGIKIGAATFLGAVYQREVSENNEYAKKTRAVADLLPGKGDCNPVTQRGCYCAQAETENDTSYCQTELHKKALAEKSARVTCVDNNLKADPTCSCEKMNTCFEKLMINQDVNNDLGFATGSGSPLNSIRQLTRGELQGGRLSGSSYGQTSAIAKKAMRDFANKIPGPASLTSSESKLAGIYQKDGIPGNIAANMAALSMSKAALDAGLAKAQGTSGTMGSVTYGANPNNLIEFGGGSGLNKSKTQKANDDFSGKFGSLLKKPDGNVSNSKLVEYAVAKSQQQNQISKTDSSIFEIISNRYAGSAFKKLDLEK